MDVPFFPITIMLGQSNFSDCPIFIIDPWQLLIHDLTVTVSMKFYGIYSTTVEGLPIQITAFFKLSLVT